MDALSLLLFLAIVLAATGAAAMIGGVDTRDGFPVPAEGGRMRWSL